MAHWCVPERAHVDPLNHIISVEPGHSEVEAIQAPYSLDRSECYAFAIKFVLSLPVIHCEMLNQYCYFDEISHWYDVKVICGHYFNL